MIVTLKEKIKQEKAFTGIDLSISVMIIIIAVAVIASMSYNLYLSGSGIKRNVMATDYQIEIQELIQATKYEEVTFKDNTALKTKLDDLLKTTGTTNDTENSYTGRVNNFDVFVQIENYKDKFETEENKEDYVKIITVKISYNLGKSKNVETLEIKTLKTIN